MSRRGAGARGSAAQAGRAPAAWRDPWAWLAGAAALLLPLRMAGAPLGHVAGDDFLFLRATRVLHQAPLLGGGGLPVYWRPLARQAYYGLLGPLMLAHPAAIAALHTALLALAAFAVCRALRGALPGPAAGAAAAFPLLAAGHRVLVAWPAHFQDVGAYAFAALALLAAARRRLAAALAAAGAALLCKEIAAAAVVLLPLAPFAFRDPGARRRAALGVGALLAGWLALYAAAVRWGGVTFARAAIAADAAERARGLGERLRWALARSLGDAFSLTAMTPRPAWIAAGAVAALAAAALLAAALRPVARARLTARLPLVGFGLAWFTLGTLMLTQVTLPWVPSRAVVPLAGFGVALVALLDAAHPALPAALAALQLATFAFAPPVPPRLTMGIATTGGGDYPAQLARMQFLARDVERALRAARPRLAPGAVVVPHAFPRLTAAMWDPQAALQTWYADTTLCWRSFADFARDPRARVDAIVEYQPGVDPAMAVVEPDAMRAVLGPYPDPAAWLAALDAADATQGDRNARVFLGLLAGRRAEQLAALGDPRAEAQAERAVALDPDPSPQSASRRLLAEVRARLGGGAKPAR